MNGSRAAGWGRMRRWRSEEGALAQDEEAFVKREGGGGIVANATKVSVRWVEQVVELETVGCNTWYAKNRGAAFGDPAIPKELRRGQDHRARFFDGDFIPDVDGSEEFGRKLSAACVDQHLECSKADVLGRVDDPCSSTVPAAFVKKRPHRIEDVVVCAVYAEDLH